MRFSVLMTYYNNDSPIYLDQALKSLHDQEVVANEILLIQDGPVSDELKEVVNRWSEVLPIVTLRNEKNVGLGRSLNYGLEMCQEEIIARMDADDICHKDRFKKQIEFLSSNKDVSVVGCSIAEFENDTANVKSYRTLPDKPTDLYYFSKKRCPLNHPSVMFRRKDVLTVGGYGHYRNQQDYHLWVRMLNEGYKIANIKEPLLYMRVSNDLFTRRGGLNYFKMEYAIQKEFYEIGFLSMREFIRNISIRFVSRILPNKVRKVFYTRLLR